MKYQKPEPGELFDAWKFPTTMNRKEVLHTDPHYSDKRFKKPQTIFGEKVEGLNYDYSDRLVQWDYDKSKRAWLTAKEKHQPHTADFFSAYLSAYYDREIEVMHIIAGVNVGNGYSYLCFGYQVKSEATP